MRKSGKVSKLHLAKETVGALHSVRGGLFAEEEDARLDDTVYRPQPTDWSVCSCNCPIWA